MFHKPHLWAFLILLAPCLLFAQDAPSFAPTTTPSPTDTPAPKTGKPRTKTSGSIQIILVHKPQPPSAWGKVIQYKREDILALSEKNRETLHEFVFQDEDGVIRTATYHENAAGEGYWEVLVWDLP